MYQGGEIVCIKGEIVCITGENSMYQVGGEIVCIMGGGEEIANMRRKVNCIQTVHKQNKHLLSATSWKGNVR